MKRKKKGPIQEYRKTIFFMSSWNGRRFPISLDTSEEYRSWKTTENERKLFTKILFLETKKKKTNKTKQNLTIIIILIIHTQPPWIWKYCLPSCFPFFIMCRFPFVFLFFQPPPLYTLPSNSLCVKRFGMILLWICVGVGNI